MPDDIVAPLWLKASVLAGAGGGPLESWLPDALRESVGLNDAVLTPGVRRWLAESLGRAGAVLVVDALDAGVL